jgi:hypothetical protein
MKSRQTHVENVNADYFEICKNAPQIASMHLFEIQSSKHKSFSFLK